GRATGHRCCQCEEVDAWRRAPIPLRQSPEPETRVEAVRCRGDVPGADHHLATVVPGRPGEAGAHERFADPTPLGGRVHREHPKLRLSWAGDLRVGATGKHE